MESTKKSVGPALDLLRYFPELRRQTLSSRHETTTREKAEVSQLKETTDREWKGVSMDTGVLVGNEED